MRWGLPPGLLTSKAVDRLRPLATTPLAATSDSSTEERPKGYSILCRIHTRGGQGMSRVPLVLVHHPPHVALDVQHVRGEVAQHARRQHVLPSRRVGGHTAFRHARQRQQRHVAGGEGAEGAEQRDTEGREQGIAYPPPP